MQRGSYYGTEIDGKWWRRYRGEGFFARGNGEFWADEEGVHFRKTLNRVPLSIPWDEISSIRLGGWHCGRPGYGLPLLKVDFHRDGRTLTAGFRLLEREIERLASDLRERLSRR